MKLGERKDIDAAAHLSQSKEAHNYKLDTSKDNWLAMKAPKVNDTIIRKNNASDERPAFQNEMLLESTKKVG